MKFCWTTLHVSDMRRSLEFYSVILGLGPAVCMGNDAHRVVMLGDADGTRLELMCDGSPVPADAGKGISVGFAPENLDALIENLRDKHGISAVGPVSPTPDIRFFFIRDPDGYTVQLLEQR